MDYVFRSAEKSGSLEEVCSCLEEIKKPLSSLTLAAGGMSSCLCVVFSLKMLGKLIVPLNIRL